MMMKFYPLTKAPVFQGESYVFPENQVIKGAAGPPGSEGDQVIHLIFKKIMKPFFTKPLRLFKITFIETQPVHSINPAG